MEKVLKALALFILVAYSAVLPAQNKQQKQLEEKVEQLRKAMIDGDSVMLDKLASENLTYRHSGGHMDDKKEFVHKLASGQSDFVSIDLSNPVISIINKKTAVVYHTLNAKTNDGGKPADVNLYIMLVWEKQHKEWKLVARQAAKKL